MKPLTLRVLPILRYAATTACAASGFSRRQAKACRMDLADAVAYGWLRQSMGPQGEARYRISEAGLALLRAHGFEAARSRPSAAA
ncbi:MAG TPA: hypothetical protein VEH84_06150 [Alphaproteobacteria bacterium]|nr:hypothetical protein [Alphaproteobacteria bacterium]